MSQQGEEAFLYPDIGKNTIWNRLAKFCFDPCQNEYQPAGSPSLLILSPSKIFLSRWAAMIWTSAPTTLTQLSTADPTMEAVST